MKGVTPLPPILNFTRLEFSGLVTCSGGIVLFLSPKNSIYFIDLYLWWGPSTRFWIIYLVAKSNVRDMLTQGSRRTELNYQVKSRVDRCVTRLLKNCRIVCLWEKRSWVKSEFEVMIRDFWITNLFYCSVNQSALEICISTNLT